MEYVRHVDFAAIAKSGTDERLSRPLIDYTSGVTTCTAHWVKTPVGGGTPEGMHMHDVDQFFYVVSGTLSVDIEGTHYKCPPGSLIIFPAGVRHRNWNGGTEPALHIAFNTPQADPNVPFTRLA